MSLHSDNSHSSSSPVRKDSDHNRSRSRSREKHRRRDRDERNSPCYADRHKGSRRQKVVRVPEFSEELVSFRAFLATQPDKISREIVEKEYEAYKQQWEEKNNQAFFKKHNVLPKLCRVTRGSSRSTILKSWTPSRESGESASTRSLRSSSRLTRVGSTTPLISQSKIWYLADNLEFAGVHL